MDLKLSTLAVAALGLVMVSANCSADNYDYYGKAALKLGGGFRKLNPSQPPAPCLVISGQTVTVDNTVSNFQLQTNLVKDRQQLYTLLHIDARLAARSLAASGSVDTSLDKETSMESDDITWVMYAYQEFGSKTIDPILNAQASPLQKSPPKLLQRCGPEYVQSVKTASEIAAVFTLHNLNQSTKNTLQAHFDGGVTLSGGSVNFSANYKSFLSEATQHGSVEIKIFGFGGSGISKLSDIVLSGDNFENVRSTLATYIKTEITADKAVPISFTTAAFGDLTDPPISTAITGNPPQLDSLYLEYGNVLSRIRRVEEVVGGRNGRYGYVSDKQVAYLNGSRVSLVAHLSQLQKQAAQCNVPQGACEFPSIDSQIIDWPISPEPSCSDWKDGSCIVCEIPISFMAALSGTTFRFACNHMPEGNVKVHFEGLFVTVSVVEPDNKVWNTWITISAQGLDQCSPCTGQRVSPGLGSGGPTTYDRYWKTFDFGGVAKVSAGKAQVVLSIDRCQAGDHATTCDTAPPGTGSNHTLDGITNRGFPGSYPPPQSKVRFEVEHN